MKEIDIKLTHGQTHCRVHDKAAGEWVVLIHGLITPQFAWRYLFDDLVVQGYRVVSFDLYGRGESAIPDVDYTFKLYLHQLDEVIQAFCKSEKNHLIGWSMGGAIASLYAMKHGSQINKLILIAPGIKITSGHFLRRILQHDVASALFARIGEQTLRARMRDQFHAPEKFDEYYALAMVQIHRAGFWQSLTSTMSNYPENLMDTLAYYPDNSPRPLIIWGEDDEITAYSGSAEITALMGGQLISFANAAHAVHYEYPERVNKIIVSYFLET